MKTIVRYFVFLELARAALGQSFFEVTNQELHRSEGVVDAPVFDADGHPLTANHFLAELWGSNTPDSLQPLPAYDSGNRVFASFRQATPGYFWSGQTVMVTNVPLWGWAWLQIRAWDSRLGPTYEEVAARGLGGYGESPLFYAQGSAGPFCDPPCLSAPLIGLQSFKLREATAVLMRQIRWQTNQVVIEWSPGFTHYQLQETSDLNQAWQNVGALTTLNSASSLVTNSAKFFRVIGSIE